MEKVDRAFTFPHKPLRKLNTIHLPRVTSLIRLSQGLFLKLYSVEARSCRAACQGGDMRDLLEGKAILIVDDEPDVLEALGELLDMCVIDYARDFATAEKYLKENSYDAAIFDIMGVEGYKLLQLARLRELPALMLTAHALSPDNLLKSIKGGAFAYVPKDEMPDIDFYLADIILAKSQNDQNSHIWFEKLIPVFDQNFGSDWKNNHREDLKDFNLIHSREDLEKIL